MANYQNCSGLALIYNKYNKFAQVAAIWIRDLIIQGFRNCMLRLSIGKPCRRNRSSRSTFRARLVLPSRAHPPARSARGLNGLTEAASVRPPSASSVRCLPSLLCGGRINRRRRRKEEQSQLWCPPREIDKCMPHIDK